MANAGANPAMGGLIMNTPASLKRKMDYEYDTGPPKKFSFNGEWELPREDMRTFVSTCNIYKTLRILGVVVKIFFCFI